MSQLYVDVETAKATLDLTGTTYADADIDGACAAAMAAVEDVCNRRFWWWPQAFVVEGIAA